MSVSRILIASALLLGSSVVMGQGEPAACEPFNFGAVASASPSGATTNGGFEINGGESSNEFAGWTVVDQEGGNGSWCVQSGTASPIFGFDVEAPPEGSFAAMTDTGGPGSHVLYQDIDIPAGATTLTFQLYLQNLASDYAVPTPATLDFNEFPNQQFRADLMDPTASVFDVGTGVLANIYQTLPGDPQESGYTEISFDLAPFQGQTVRLRFAEVDNQGQLLAGIDQVIVNAEEPNVFPSEPMNVPTLSSLFKLLMLFSLLGIGVIAVRFR